MTGVGVTAGTVITAGSGTAWTVNNSQTVGSGGSPVAMSGGNGLSWTVSVSQTLSTASFNGHITPTGLTIDNSLVGTVAIGQAVTGVGVQPGTVITGGSGTMWTVTPSQTVTGPTAMTTTPAFTASSDFQDTIATFVDSSNVTLTNPSGATTGVVNARVVYGYDNTAALLAAPNCWRSPGRAKPLSDPSFGDITAYRSGVVKFSGSYLIQAGALVSPTASGLSSSIGLYDLYGLCFRGLGSRLDSNYTTGRSRLSFYGANSVAQNSGIALYSNGSRGFTVSDIDFEYVQRGFSGFVLDIFRCTGTNLRNSYVGCGATQTRPVSATACIRLSGSEAVNFKNVTYNGAQYGLLIDNSRGSLGVNGFQAVGGQMNDLAQYQVGRWIGAASTGSISGTIFTAGTPTNGGVYSIGSILSGGSGMNHRRLRNYYHRLHFWHRRGRHLPRGPIADNNKHDDHRDQSSKPCDEI